MGKWSSLKPAGFTESQSWYGGSSCGETWRCVNCGAHHDIHPGSGKLRAFSIESNGPICIECIGNVPFEQYLANLDAGMPDEVARKFRPIKASVPANFQGPKEKKPPGGVILG